RVAPSAAALGPGPVRVRRDRAALVHPGSAEKPRIFSFLFHPRAFRALPAAESPPARPVVVLRAGAAHRAVAVDAEHPRRPGKSMEGTGPAGLQARPLSRHLGRRGGGLLQRIALEAPRLRPAGGSGDSSAIRPTLSVPVRTPA